MSDTNSSLPSHPADRLAWLSLGLSATGGVAIGVIDELPVLAPLKNAHLWHSLLVLFSAALVVAIVALVLARRRGQKSAQWTSVAAALLLLVVAAGGYVSGRKEVFDRIEAQMEQARLQQEALTNYPGWNGGWPMGAARILVNQVPEESEYARMFAAQFREPFCLFVVHIDNTRGSSAIELDLNGATLVGAAPSGQSLARHAILAGAQQGKEDFLRQHGGAYSARAGGRIDGALLFFPSQTDTRRAMALKLLINGTPQIVPGRYFSVAEKKQMMQPRH